MSEDLRKKAINDTMTSLDAAIGTPNKRSMSRWHQSILEEPEQDMASLMYEEVTVPFGHGGMESIFDQTTAAILNQDDPGAKTTQILFTEFINIMVSHQSDVQIWEEIAAYEKLCSEQVEILEKVIKKSPKDHDNFIRTKDMAMKMQRERDTWRLLGSLCNERMSEDTEEMKNLSGNLKNKTDHEIISELYESNSKLRTAQVVIDWLERNTQDSYFQNLGYITHTNMGWENTHRNLKNIQNKVVDNSSVGKRSLVSSLDPDAPIREGKLLHDLDQEEDTRLLKLMFGWIRSGQLSEAQELCIKSGHPWRAAVLEGWKLYHDPNIRESGNRKPVLGNSYRDAWKSSAWAAASDTSLPVYERAMYGAMCGHLPSLLEVCHSWVDLLWAYFRTLVDQYVEECLRGNSIHLRPFNNLPEDYPDYKLSVDEIFDAISSRLGEKRFENKYNIIQEYLIRDDIEYLIDVIIDWLHKGDMTPHLLRCVSHMLIILKRVGKIPYTRNEQLVEILHECAKEAIERGDAEQVAWYSSVLPERLQVPCFSSFLMNIHDEHLRKHALQLSSLVGLNTQSITATVVATIRLTTSGETSDLNTDVTHEDKIKINAIDWLLFDSRQRPEALRQANCLMRTFLLARKVKSAKMLFSKIPEDSMDILVQLHQEGSTDPSLPLYYENRMREYLCYKIFLSAQEAFADWFDHYHQNKPQCPKKQKAEMKFVESLAHEHAMKQYNSELQKWKQASKLLSKKATERLYNILLFPEGGWLTDVFSPDDSMTDDASNKLLEFGPEEYNLLKNLDPEIASREHPRGRQLNNLRAMYIPQTFSLLQNVLHGTEKFKEAIQLSELMASEQYRLYKCFTTGELQRFLLKLQETSKELLDQNCDALGYPTF